MKIKENQSNESFKSSQIKWTACSIKAFIHHCGIFILFKKTGGVLEIHEACVPRI